MRAHGERAEHASVDTVARPWDVGRVVSCVRWRRGVDGAQHEFGRCELRYVVFEAGAPGSPGQGRVWGCC